MSNYPPNGPPPPYGYGPGGPHPPPPGAPGYAYVPAPVMMPLPVYHPYPTPHPQPQPYQPYPPPDHGHPEGPTTSITTVTHSRPTLFPNLRETLEKTLLKVDQCVNSILTAREVVDWAQATPATAPSLGHRPYIAGKEGWDDSALWVIRSHYNGDFVPGKFALNSRAAYIPHGGKEIPVYDFEVLLAPQHALRWLPSSHGQVPPGAFPAGNTRDGEPLYIGRVAHLRSTTPGKVHPSHGCCYISFGGAEIAYKQYEVLCKIVG